MNATMLHTVMLAANRNSADQGQRWLVQIHPLDLEQNRIELGTQPVIIGRSEQCHVILDDESVSRQHAQIRCCETGYEIVDMRSTNGVVVNDELVECQKLQTGDRIQLGRRIFRFLADNDVESQYHETVYGMMTRDGLTSVFNKRYLLECLDREVVRSCRHHRPLSVILLDIDHFKQINDTHGHLVGDEVLREVAMRLGQLLRSDEVLARFGGEEFAIIDGEADLETSAALAEQCREAIASQAFHTSAGAINVTISLGVAAPELSQSTTPAELLSLADVKLYEAKRAGRNRVVV